MLEQDAEVGPRSQKPAGPLRQLAGELYRLLPALAIGVAALAILVTVGQVLLGRTAGQAAQQGPPSPAAAAAPASPTISAAATEKPEPTAVPTSPPATATPLPPTATAAPPTPTAEPATATATAEPVATLRLTNISPRRVRAQGRIRQPDAQTYYWFLISEPGRPGVFRQGPAAVNEQGSFVYDLDLQPLNAGPDSVTLAAIPSGLSVAWTSQALRTGSWLPVIPVTAQDGITFLSEVRL